VRLLANLSLVCQLARPSGPPWHGVCPHPFLLRTTIKAGSSSELDPASPDAPVAPLHSIRVWLVDDNARFRNLLAQLLGMEAGIECTRQFASPAAVLDALVHETPPDVILLDIEMGAQCGLDAIQPIRALAQATQVIMLTAFYDSAWEQRAILEGAANFLLKRTTVNEIAAHIHEAHQHPVAHRLALDFNRSQTSVSARAKSPLQRGINLIRSLLLGI
jgi:DNA-binding NarL/FixJ family response regulator